MEKKNRMIQILITGNDFTTAELIRTLPQDKYHVTTVQTASHTMALLRGNKVDVVILGMKLPDGNGIDLLVKLKVMYPPVEVIMFIGQHSVKAAIKSMKLGAYDCLTKPVECSKLSRVIHKAYESKRLKEKRTQSAGGTPESPSHEFIGESKQIQEVRKLVSLVGRSNVAVLILGETGTGKELVARAIHEASSRSKGPFVIVNASSLL
ncbi:MAG: DNA-binding response regulator, partial [Syntrophus sp. (in: bacteria)]|nr:DNA-binding response regulator [Syntrophus sp. (in: bacteria)]